jgi:transcriptional regulator with XRE-family HTH domain
MKLKEFRQSKNLTQEKFAQRIGFTLSMVAQVERGKVKASRNFIDKVKEAFPDVDINSVFFA